VSGTVFGYGAACVNTFNGIWAKRLFLTCLALTCLLSSAALESASGAAPVGSSNAASKLLNAAIASAGRQGSVRVTFHFVN
jgi:hypothetical protein